MEDNERKKRAFRFIMLITMVKIFKTDEKSYVRTVLKKVGAKHMEKVMFSSAIKIQSGLRLKLKKKGPTIQARFKDYLRDNFAFMTMFQHELQILLSDQAKRGFPHWQHLYSPRLPSVGHPILRARLPSGVS